MGRALRSAFKIVARKHEGKIPFRRPGHKWEDNIK
jgi:hypothetical protein